MTRPRLEVADVFRRFGLAWRAANAGHLSLAQRRVMRAVELCRTAELGGHVEQCADCAHTRIAYNSCRNRHCPKRQWTAAQAWLEAREAELLPVPYFHVVFTLPAALGPLAYQNKARVYGLLLRAAAETLTTIAADPKHLGARIGVTAVLHSWGQTLDHHPHVHLSCRPAGSPSTAAAAAPVVLPAKAHLAVVLERHQAAVGDGDAMGVAGEVGQHLLRSGEPGLGVDHPLPPPQGREVGPEGAGFPELGEVTEGPDLALAMSLYGGPRRTSVGTSAREPAPAGRSPAGKRPSGHHRGRCRRPARCSAHGDDDRGSDPSCAARR